MVEFEDTNAGIRIQAEISHLESVIDNLNQDLLIDGDARYIDSLEGEIYCLNNVLATVRELYNHTKEAYYETATNTIRKWELSNYDA